MSNKGAIIMFAVSVGLTLLLFYLGQQNKTSSPTYNPRDKENDKWITGMQLVNSIVSLFKNKNDDEDNEDDNDGENGNNDDS